MKIKFIQNLFFFLFFSLFPFGTINSVEVKIYAFGNLEGADELTAKNYTEHFLKHIESLGLKINFDEKKLFYPSLEKISNENKGIKYIFYGNVKYSGSKIINKIHLVNTEIKKIQKSFYFECEYFCSEESQDLKKELEFFFIRNNIPIESKSSNQDLSKLNNNVNPSLDNCIYETFFWNTCDKKEQINLKNQTEIIGNRELKEDSFKKQLSFEEEENLKYQQDFYNTNYYKMKYRYFAYIGLPDGVSKMANISIGYNLTKKISIGITKNTIHRYYNDFGSSYDLYNPRNLSYGIFTSGQSFIQQYGGIERVPNAGYNLFLHFFPFQKVPIYIPFYLGRTIRSKVITSSLTDMSNPFYANNHPSNQVANIYMTAENIPTTYYGSGIGIRYQPERVFFGIEFGWVRLNTRELSIYAFPSLINKTPVTPVEMWLFEEQLKRATNAPDVMKLNYGIIIGISI